MDYFRYPVGKEPVLFEHTGDGHRDEIEAELESLCLIAEKLGERPGEILRSTRVFAPTEELEFENHWIAMRNAEYKCWIYEMTEEGWTEV